MGFFSSIGGHLKKSLNLYTSLGDRANQGWGMLGGKIKEIIGLAKGSSQYVMDNTKGNPFLKPIHKFANDINDYSNYADMGVQQIDNAFELGNKIHNDNRNTLERFRR